MKIKLLLATLIGAVTLNGAVAGPCNYCPPPAKCCKCPVDCCEDSPGFVGVSMGSDYIFRGVRHAEEFVGLHASYTIDACCIPVTLGVNHISSLSSNDRTRLGFNGDHTDLFAAVGLPSVCGFDLGLRYDHYLYPNLRSNQSLGGFGNQGDSHGAVSLNVSREIACGWVLAYTGQYDLNSPSAQAGFLGGAAGALGNGPTGLFDDRNQDNGAWIHTLDLSKSFCITDCIGLDLRGGVVYTDNVWSSLSARNGAGRNLGPTNSAGWNNYYLEAALPIKVGCCATLSPYINYTGTPDTWQADGVGIGQANGANNYNSDSLNGGVRLGVNF